MAATHDPAAMMKNINHGTIDELNDEQLSIFKQFRIQVEDIMKDEDDDYILRWLIARKFNIGRAEDMLRAHMKLRKDFDTDGITETKLSKLKEEIGYGYLGLDKEGNGTFIFSFEFMDLKGLGNSYTVYDIILIAVYEIDKAIQLLKDRKIKNQKTGMKLNLIVDLTGIRIPRSLFIMRQHLKLLQAFEANFPEVMNKVIIINIPAIFYPWFNCLKLALDGRTLGKIAYVQKGGDTDVILDLIDADLVPACIGGNRTDPDGNPTCKTLYPHVSKISKSKYYKYQDPALILWNIHAVELEIARRSYLNIVVDVTKPGSWIHWLIRTRGCNLGFGIYYCGHYQSRAWEETFEDIKNDVENWIQPHGIFDTYPTPMEWKVFCKRPGKYVCHFDNTYSWFTAKQIAFVIALILPDRSQKYIIGS